MSTLKLSSLQPGQTAEIRSIHADEALFLRFQALGFRTGKLVEVLRRARFLGPVHVRIGTTEIMLRPAEAERVEIGNIQ